MEATIEDRPLDTNALLGVIAAISLRGDGNGTK
jgi:hypothetical protein